MLSPWVATNEEFFLMYEFLLRTNPKTVLEYGAGGSTTIYPYFVPNLQRWIAIEANPEWCEKVKEHLPKDRPVEIYLVKPTVESTEYAIWCTHPAYKDYVLYPSRFDLKFDCIYIDGNVRFDVFENCRHYAHSETLILHHDSLNEPHATNIKKISGIKLIETFGQYSVFRFTKL